MTPKPSPRARARWRGRSARYNTGVTNRPKSHPRSAGSSDRKPVVSASDA